jgi:hypothetical protein
MNREALSSKMVFLCGWRERRERIKERDFVFRDFFNTSSVIAQC